MSPGCCVVCVESADRPVTLHPSLLGCCKAQLGSEEALQQPAGQTHEEPTHRHVVQQWSLVLLRLVEL